MLKEKLKQLNIVNLLSKLAALSLLVSFSACSDQGCIDADDFGEYESQTIEVSANSTQTNCSYDPSKELSDIAQGISLRNGCFLTGSPSVTDENGDTFTPAAATGCHGFGEDVRIKSICISECIQKCQANSGSDSGLAEPSWESTTKKIAGRNSGVTVRAGSEISIRAIGNISLGNSAEYDHVYVQGDNSLPHSKNINWQPTIFDARLNQTLNFKFSGEFDDGVDKIGSGIRNLNNETFNGSKKLIAYIIPHPESYDYDYSQTNYKEGTKVVPLLPDINAWQCTYTGSDSKESSCKNKDAAYTTLGYTNADDTKTAEVFPATSASKSPILGSYGGMIRWNNDGLEPNSFNPSLSIGCDSSGSCTNTSTLEAKDGIILGNIDAGLTITNNSQYARKVSFKSLTGDNKCNATLNIVAVSASGHETNHTIVVNETDFSTQFVVSEPRQQLRIQSSQAYEGTTTNCGRMIVARYLRYHDVAITKSGLVKFTMLGSSGTCALKARIINKNAGVHDLTGLPSPAITSPDFYEYDSFQNTSSTDPLNNLTVPTSVTSSIAWSSSTFVRKGQFIRFDPESWNGTWVAGIGASRQCGIGMAMMIDHRPAVLCPRKITDIIYNPNCETRDFDGGVLIGCSPTSSTCSDDTSSSYCPISGCQPPITCTTNGVAELFQKSSCSKGAIDTTACGTFPVGGTYTEASCQSCGDDMLASALTPAKKEEANIYKCYDLEEYQGKVSNITGSTRSEIITFLSNPTLAKGAKELGVFNGSYGNLDNFTATGDTDSATGNKIYQLRTPVTISRPGRLRFFVAAGTEFNGSNGAVESYDNNTAAGSSYTGFNGFKISPVGGLDFSNGDWLQARLCKETNDDTYICKDLKPTHQSGASQIIEITPPSSTAPIGAPPTIDSPYKFDSYGNLLRTKAADKSVDCTLAADGLVTTVGSTYYCHKISEGEGLLRLTFKIYDPERSNCTIAGSPGGVLAPNPYYDSAVDTTGQTCSSTELPVSADEIISESGTTNCVKKFYCANKYYNNSGKYYVNIRVKNLADGNVSNIIEGVVKPVVEAMDGPKNGSEIGQAERVYRLLISDPRYKSILSMTVILMFAFYGVGYLMGVSELSHSEVINRVIKIGLIYMFVGEYGWYWFDKLVVKFFKDGTDYLAFMMASSFDSSPEIAEAISNNDYYDKSILFGSVDKVFGMFFSQAVQKKISALLFASIFGWAYLIIIYNAFLLYVYAVANAVLLYLTAQVFISILFTLGPIFFIFTLFKQTKEMFDKWLSQLIGFSLQQIFLLTTLAFFNMLMYEVIKMSLGYKICWDDVWTINIITRITLMSFWTIASLPPRTNAQSDVGNIGNPEGIPSLFSILFIWVIASLMNKFITFMTDIAASMGGGLSASKMSSGITEAAKELKQRSGKFVEKRWEKTGGRALAHLDHKLFDSGKYAKKARKKRKKANAADRRSKSSLLEAGKDSMSQFKKANAHILSGKSKEQQRELLDKAKEKGMSEKAEQLGISKHELERLKNDKGLKYEGNNIIGAGLTALVQGARSGGALRKSVNERKTSTKISHDEAQTALKIMSKEQRAEFIANASEGKIKVGKNKKDKLAGAYKSVPKYIGKGLSKGLKSFKETMKSANAFGGDSEYDIAEKQLVAEGSIDAMKKGTKWARSDDQKKLIRARKKENTKAQKAKDKVGTSPNALTQLKREDQFLSAKEDINASNMGDMEKLAMEAKAYATRAMPGKMTAEGRTRHEKSKQTLKAGASKRNAAEVKSAAEQKKDADGQLEAAMGELATAEDALHDYEDTKGISREGAVKHSFYQRHLKPNEKNKPTRAEKKAQHEKFEKLQSDRANLKKSDETYADLDDAHKAANKTVSNKKVGEANAKTRTEKTTVLKTSSDRKTTGKGYEGQSQEHKDARDEVSKDLEQNSTDRADLQNERGEKMSSISEKKERLRDIDRKSGNNPYRKMAGKTPEQKAATAEGDSLREEIKKEQEGYTDDSGDEVRGLNHIEADLAENHAQSVELHASADSLDKEAKAVEKATKTLANAEPNSKKYKKAAAAISEYQKKSFK